LRFQLVPLGFDLGETLFGGYPQLKLTFTVLACFVSLRDDAAHHRHKCAVFTEATPLRGLPQFVANRDDDIGV
jgi:hypothetical protein